MRNSPPVGPFSRPMPRALWWSAVSYARGTPAQFGGHTAQALVNAGYSVRVAVEKQGSEKVDFLRDMGCALGDPAPCTLHPEP